METMDSTTADKGGADIEEKDKEADASKRFLGVFRLYFGCAYAYVINRICAWIPLDVRVGLSLVLFTCLGFYVGYWLRGFNDADDSLMVRYKLSGYETDIVIDVATESEPVEVVEEPNPPPVLEPVAVEPPPVEVVAVEPSEIDPPVTAGGLVTLIRFDEGKGLTLSDSSPNGLMSPLTKEWESVRCWIEGNSGYALYFAGAVPEEEGGVAIPPKFAGFPGSTIKENLSVSMWLKPMPRDAVNLGTSSNKKIQFGLVQCMNAGAGWQIVLVKLDAGYRVQFMINDFTKNRRNVGMCISFLKPEQWNHVALVFKSGTIHFYVDGHLSNSRKLADTEVKHAEGAALVVGPRNELPLHLAIDELSIYNKSLDKAEVEEMYGGENDEG